MLLFTFLFTIAPFGAVVTVVVTTVVLRGMSKHFLDPRGLDLLCYCRRINHCCSGGAIEQYQLSSTFILGFETYVVVRGVVVVVIAVGRTGYLAEQNDCAGG